MRKDVTHTRFYSMTYSYWQWICCREM